MTTGMSGTLRPFEIILDLFVRRVISLILFESLWTVIEFTYSSSS